MIKKEKNYYTNEVAESLKDWHLYLLIASIIALVIVAIASIIIKSLTLFIVGVVVFTFVQIGSLSMIARAEMIQKLQNIEDKLTK